MNWEYNRGFNEAIEAAARKCEDLVTFTENHHEAGDICGWCKGLEQAASLIRALARVDTAHEESLAAAEEITDAYAPI